MLAPRNKDNLLRTASITGKLEKPFNIRSTVSRKLEKKPYVNLHDMKPTYP